MDHEHGTREFFAARAAGWDDKFPEDGPRFAAAVAALRLSPGATVLDVGCGTGRALPLLRDAVGPGGTVIGLDLVPEMLEQAVRLGRDRIAMLVRGDGQRPPLATASVDAVFAAGLLHHLDDPVAGLREFARIGRPGARLAIFHPIGRAALARKHGRVLDQDDPFDGANVAATLAAGGWSAEHVEDGADRYLVLAQSRTATGSSSGIPR